MYLYYLAFIIFLFSLYDISIERNHNRATIILDNFIFNSFLGLSLVLSSIREMGGGDWPVYYNYYISRKTWDEYNDGTFEILYAFLNFLVKQIFNSSLVFFFILAFIGIYLKYHVIKRISLYPVLALFIFFCSYLGDIFVGRQTLAISILFVSIYFIHAKKKIPFFFLSIIAICLHVTSILWLFSYYIYHKKSNNITLALLCIIMFIIGILAGHVYAKLFNMLLPLLNQELRIVVKALTYFNDYHHNNSFIKIFFQLTKRFLFIPIFLYFKKKLCNTNEYISGLLNLYFFGTAVYLLFSTAFTEFQRMTGAFLYVEVFILSAILNIINKRYFKYLYLFFLLVYGFLRISSYLQRFPDSYSPYHSILNQYF
jgi:hypothetical protein